MSIKKKKSSRNSLVNSNLKELIKNIDNIFQNISYENNINTMLDYVELYFSKENNFKDKDDYQKFNEPILNTFYNWYLKATNIDKRNEYVKILETSIENMKNLYNKKRLSIFENVILFSKLLKLK